MTPHAERGDMDMHAGSWTRRHFLQAGACAAAIAGSRVAALAPAPRSSYAVAASSAGLQTFRVVGEWQPAHAFSMPSLRHVSAHPSLPVVYACHDVALWDHLPRGAVSAWRVCSDGALNPLGTQPLSLSATHPHAATVAADGKSLVVLTRAGIYNVFPLAQGGSIGPVSVMRKEHGKASTGRVACPRNAVFHPDGTLFAVDSGQAVVSRFRLERNELMLQHRVAVSAGVQQIAVSACGGWAYALHANDGSIAVHEVTQGTMLPAHQVLPGGAGKASMLLHAGRQILFRADTSGLMAFPRSTCDGRLSSATDSIPIALRHLALTPGGTHLAGVCDATESIVEVPFFECSGIFGRHRTMAQISGCTSLAFCSA